MSQVSPEDTLRKQALQTATSQVELAFAVQDNSHAVFPL